MNIQNYNYVKSLFELPRKIRKFTYITKVMLSYLNNNLKLSIEYL